MKSGSGVAAVETPVNRIQAGRKAPRICHSKFLRPEGANIFNSI